MFSDSPPTDVHHRKLNRVITVRFRWLFQKEKNEKYRWRRVYHYFLRPRSLSIGREERKAGFWQMERTADGVDHVYMSCYWCGAVNDFSDHEVGSDGFVFPCVVCRECERHEFVCLDEWSFGHRKEVIREKA